MIEQFAEHLTAENIICLTGLILLACWLLKTSLGRDALSDSSPRRNNMPAYLPFILFLTWLGLVPAAILVVQKFTADLSDYHKTFLDSLLFCIGALLIIAIIIYVTKVTFVRRLKGFGLNVKTIHRDFFAAFINLLTIWPLMLTAIVLTIFIGKRIWGQDYSLEQHEELKTIAEYSQLSLRILIFITTLIVAPVLEEMLFRGMFQTMIRSSFELRLPNLKSQYRIWLAILISSALFAIIHQNIGHWPALFILAICLGYSYEKSGSLFRPIFIHSFFNSIAVIGVLSQ